MDRVAAAVSAPMTGPRQRDAPLEAELARIGTAVLRGVISNRAVAVLRICLGEYGRFPELARVVWDHGPALTYANFRAFLTERQQRGELDVPDTQLAAEQFIAGIVGHIQLKVAMGITDPPSDDEIAERVASAVQTFLARYAIHRSAQ